MVMYFPASSYVKPQRVKTLVQMRAGRKEHKNNKHGHLGSFCICVGHELIRGEVAVSLKRWRG